MLIAAKIKLKHGQLLGIIERHKLSQRQFAELAGMDCNTLGLIINLKRRPTVKTRNKIQRACAGLGEYIDVLEWWPESFRGLDKNSAVVYEEVDTATLEASEPARQIACEDWSIFEEAMDSLTEREREMLDMHMDGYTHSEIGGKYDLTLSRIGQIIARAETRLRRYVKEKTDYTVPEAPVCTETLPSLAEHYRKTVYDKAIAFRKTAGDDAYDFDDLKAMVQEYNDACMKGDEQKE